MIQRYTWLSLLHDVSQGKQPEAVTYRKMEFKWNGHTYVNEKEKDLMSYMSNYAADALCVVTHLSCEKQIINEQEKAYLKVALAPIKGRIETITKKYSCNKLCYLVVKYRELPAYGEEFCDIESWCFPQAEQFVGMKLNFEYTAEDLELWA